LEQRKDDRPEAVRTRLEVNLKNLEPLLDHYRSRASCARPTAKRRSKKSHTRAQLPRGRALSAILKSRDEISLMRESGRILAETLQLVVEHVRPGVIEKELDEIARREFRNGA
jgi:Xaa-Pro aminopeptidase